MSSAVSLVSERSRRMPALLTTASTRPNSSRADETISAAPSPVPTLAWLATAAPPAATISATTASAGVPVRTGAVGGAAEIVDDDGSAVRGEQQSV